MGENGPKVRNSLMIKLDTATSVIIAIQHAPETWCRIVPLGSAPRAIAASVRSVWAGMSGPASKIGEKDMTPRRHGIATGNAR